MNWYKRKIGRKLQSFKSSKNDKKQSNVEQPVLTHEAISFPVQLPQPTQPPPSTQPSVINQTGFENRPSLTGIETTHASHNELFKVGTRWVFTFKSR